MPEIETVDNVETLPKSDMTPAEQTAPKESPQQQQTMYTAGSAKEMLESYYKKPLPVVTMKFADQIMDGSKVEFTDGSNGEVLASGRLRMANVLRLIGGSLLLDVLISDLTVTTGTLNI